MNNTFLFIRLYTDSVRIMFIFVNVKFNNNYLLAIYEGYPTFVISISAIGLCTAVIGDVAGHLGCFINLKDTVNAIAFVALGTSVPGRQTYRY